MSTHTRRPIFLDALYIGALILYALGGLVAAPFHGDESTTIYVSRDWYTLTQAHDLAAVLYSPLRTAGRERDDQILRLLNGVVSKYSIGLMWSAAGMSVSEINGPWSWGDDWWSIATISSFRAINFYFCRA
jgi:hypothetical protein